MAFRCHIHSNNYRITLHTIGRVWHYLFNESIISCRYVCRVCSVQQSDVTFIRSMTSSKQSRELKMNELMVSCDREKVNMRITLLVFAWQTCSHLSAVPTCSFWMERTRVQFVWCVFRLLFCSMKNLKFSKEHHPHLPRPRTSSAKQLTELNWIDACRCRCSSNGSFSVNWIRFFCCCSWNVIECVCVCGSFYCLAPFEIIIIDCFVVDLDP